MSKRSDDFTGLRMRVLGLGERSFRKTYYPLLQQRLRELERFRALLDQSSDGILLLELPSLRCVDANRVAAGLLHEAGESVEEFDPTRTFPSEKQWFEQAGPSGSLRRGRVQLHGRNGQLPIELTAGCHRFEEREYAVLVLRDIREQLAAERRTEESKERFRELADMLPAIVLETDLEGRVTFANQMALERTGFTSSAISKVVMLEELFILEDRPRAREDLQRACEQKQAGAHRYDVLCADGSTFPVISRSLRMTRAGQTVGVRMLLLDISERAELERRAMTAQKLASMGVLAGSIAHDFNNVLTGILSLCDLILLDLPDESAVSDDIKSIRTTANRATRLTRQLLLFSRQRPAGLTTVSLNEVVEQVARVIARAVGQNVTFETDLDPDLWNINGEPSQIDQIVLNLAMNARDAMPDGGTFRIETSNVELDIESANRYLGSPEPGQHVKLEVQDSGCGIDPAVQDRVFEPFFTTKGIGKGTGLGLATVYGLIKRYRGGIHLDSAPGKGTTIRMVFPRSQKAATARDDRPAAAKALGTETILVCDDDDMVREVACRALSQCGYRVLEASFPKAALQICETEPVAIDLLLTDIIMPEMNGYALARAFHARSPTTRILFMSGYSHDERHGAIDDAGEMLEKPFSVKQLIERVREALQTKAPTP